MEVEEGPPDVSQYVALLDAAKAALPVHFRADGPLLGFEFDPVPTGAVAGVKRKRPAEVRK